MRSLALRAPHQLEIVDLPPPTPGPYGVLLRMLAGGICGTDLHLLRGSLDFATYPCLLGHESVGRVVARGERVRAYAEGDLVLKGTPAPPGTTYAGFASLWASFSEFGLAFDDAAFRADHPPSAWPQIPAWADSQQVLPSDFDPLDGGMLVVFRETLSVAMQAGVGPGRRVVVTGTGPAGLSFVRACKLLGADAVVAYGRRPEPLAAARALGADAVVCAPAGDASRVLLNELGGLADLVIECTGSAQLLETARDWLAPGGRIVLYAVYDQPAIHMSTGLGDFGYVRFSPRDGAVHQQAIDAWRLGWFDLAALRTHVFDLRDAREAFATVDDRRGLKVVIRLDQ